MVNFSFGEVQRPVTVVLLKTSTAERAVLPYFLFCCGLAIPASEYNFLGYDQLEKTKYLLIVY